MDEYGKSYSVNIRNRFKSAAQHILVANYDIRGVNLFVNEYAAINTSDEMEWLDKIHEMAINWSR